MTATDMAAQHAREVCGLTNTPTAQWTDVQKSAYLAANAAYSKATPRLFTAAQLAAADNYAMAATVKDADFSWIDVTWDALGESVSELPGRINTAIDTVGKSILGSIPLWLRWLIGGALVAYLFVLIRPYLPTPAKHTTPSRKHRKYPKCHYAPQPAPHSTSALEQPEPLSASSLTTRATSPPSQPASTCSSAPSTKSDPSSKNNPSPPPPARRIFAMKKRTTKRTKAKKTKRKIPLAKPATRKRCAAVVGRAGGYATTRKRKAKIKRKAARKKATKQLSFW